MSPIACVLKSVKNCLRFFISHLNVFQPTTLRIHICHQNSAFFIRAKFQDIYSWLQMRSTNFNSEYDNTLLLS